MKRILVLAGVALSSCERPQPAEWETAPVTYRCTDAQMERVIRETKSCVADTSYFGTYCYGAAFIRNCSKASGGVQ